MENIPEEANKPINEEEHPEQPTIFSDISTDMSGYQKNIKRARVWLYIIGGYQIIIGVSEYIKYADYAENIRWLIFGIDALIGILFIGLAMLSYRKAVIAFISALILYVVVNIWVLYSTGFTALSFYWILKIVVIVALIRAIKDAQEHASLKQRLD